MKSELTYEEVLGAAGTPIVSTDMLGNIISVNKLAMEILGLTSGKDNRISFNIVFPDANYLVTECLKTGERQSGDFTFFEDNTFRVIVVPIRRGKKVSGTVCSFEEMRDFRAPVFDQGLKRGISKQLDALIESLYDGIWIMDGYGTVLNVNATALNLHDLKVEEILGRNIKELVEKGIIDRSSTMEVLATKGQVNILQYLTKGRRYLLVTATPIFDEKGEITRVVVIDRDMTQLRSMWERLDQTLMLKGNSADELSKLNELEFKGTKVVAVSGAMRRVLGIALRLGQLSVSNILLLGESGTGKGLVAKLIHENSKRKLEPYIQVNCAALPDGLVEAELFGYEKGAFTGAKPKGKIGLFELAQEGTLFLDEIGELPLSTQAKLLKCLDENEIMPVGGLKTKRVRCSIIAATNKDLDDLVRKRIFREDLFYRLNAFNIKIPPIRERPEDILELTSNFLFSYNQTYKTEKQLSKKAFEQLKTYSFPGNVRELDNLLKNAIIMSDTNLLDDYVANYISSKTGGKEDPALVHPQDLRHRLSGGVAQAEISALKEAAKLCKTTREIAKYLGISQATVVRKLKKYDLSSGHSEN